MKKSWKKFLPLVICLALCMSLFTVSASAAAPSTKGDIVDNGDGTYKAVNDKGETIQNGWVAVSQKVDGKVVKTWYYAVKGELAEGWHNIDGDWYYFDENNKPYMHANDNIPVGDHTYNSSEEFQNAKDWYWVDADGALHVDNSGWVSRLVPNAVYNENTGKYEPRRIFFFANSDGSLQKGWLADDGNWYALYPEMAAGEKDENNMISYPGWRLDKENNGDPASVPHYFINPDGTVATGWASYMDTIITKHGKEVPVRQFVYADPDAYGALVNGWNQIDGKWYFFVPQTDEDDAWRANTLIYATNDNNGFFQLDDGNWYRVDKSGAQVFGWNRAENTNDSDPSVYNWYFAKPDNSGALATDEFVQIDGKWYYFDENQILEDNGQFEYNGDTYYAGKDGALVTGWVQDAADQPWYHYADNGTMDTGWIEDGGNWYYLNEDGTMAQNEWTEDGYYVGSDGAWTEWTPEG